MNAPDIRLNGGETDAGTAYGRPAPTYRRELAEVGPGTPMGELLRRYWHPVGLAGDATDTPRQVRVLGEDLILLTQSGIGEVQIAGAGASSTMPQKQNPEQCRNPIHHQGSP